MYLSKVLRAQVKIASVFFLLTGCGYNTSGQDDTIEFPALPIIQLAVDSLVPKFDGQKNDEIMNMVCALARGRQTQEQVFQIMKAQGVDLYKIPQQGHPLSLLVNSDLAQKISACAAFVATSVMKIPSLREVTVDIKVDESSDMTAARIDPVKLDQLLGGRLAIAKANSDVYALISQELGKNQGKTLVQYDEQVKQLFKKIAPVYLQRVKVYAEAEQGQRHTLEELNDYTFKFNSGSGYRFELGYDGIYLTLNRFLWFGGNVMIGKNYQLRVKYFEPELLVFH